MDIGWDSLAVVMILVFLLLPALYHQGNGTIGWKVGASMLKGITFLVEPGCSGSMA